MKTLVAAAPVALLLAACSSDTGPVSYSAPVGITLPAITSSQASTPPLTTAKGISNASGNPYGAFVNNAKAALGRDPSSVAVTSASLELLASSTGVTTLQQVFTGTVAVTFLVKGTNTAYPVASIANPTGAGPIQLTAAFDFASLAPADKSAMIQGQFDVVVTGPPATGFAALSAKADLQAVFTFIAYP